MAADLIEYGPWFQWEYEVTYQQMAESGAGSALPGGDRFVIVSEAYNTTEPCLEMGEDEVAVQLYLGEFVTLWKQIALNVFENPNSYRPLIEMEGSQSSYIAIFSKYELVDYRLCFWKEENDIITPYQNYYMMVDAADALKPQHLYQFYWVRDDA